LWGWIDIFGALERLLVMFGSNTVTAFAPGNGSTDEQFGAEEKYTLDLLDYHNNNHHQLY